MYVSTGSLSDGVYCVSFQDAAKLVKCVLGAISYVHNVHNISHRDLKPENFIFETVMLTNPYTHLLLRK